MPRQPDPALTAEAVALLSAQAEARSDLTRIAQAAVVAELAGFRGWYDDGQVAGLAGRLQRQTRAAQKQMANSTTAYGIRLLRLLLGRRSAPAKTVPLQRVYGGEPLASVYERVAAEYRWLHATRSSVAPVEARISPRTGRELPVLDDGQILDRVVERARTQTESALTLTFRQQWVAQLDLTDDVAGYRRIVHPELSTGGTCGLCIVASDNVYRRDDLMPIHHRCSCTVMPIVGDLLGPGDPGSAINSEDLDQFYAAAGDSTLGANLKATKYRVEQDGNLGPVLVYQGQHFRSPEEAAATKARVEAARSRRSVARAKSTLSTAEAALKDLRSRQAAGEDVRGQLRFQRAAAARARKTLAHA